MHIFNIIRNVLIVLFLIIGFIVIRNSSAQRKLKYYVLWTIVSFIFSFVITLLPFENIFVSFYDPESIFEYENPKATVHTVLEGEASSMCFGKSTDGQIRTSVAFKSGTKWKIARLTDMESAVYTYGNLWISWYRYKGTNDYYVDIYDFRKTFDPVTDCRNTNFSVVRSDKEKEIRYYGYVPKMDENYYLEIDGEKVYPLK